MEDLRSKIVKLERERGSLSQEKDQALEDLKNVEKAFSDLHKRYERAKSTLENMKKNEDLLIQRDQLLCKKLEAKDHQISKLREEVQSSLETMHTDYEEKARSMDVELTKLRALVRKSDMKISTLESDLEKKTKENAELHGLCDELINSGAK